ncbi:hypothetical protein TIFTF001_001881 [Ficus carica]|uniref:Uncharacterized protein n=1 Tax=Ficus carica TaxID=3494 RepID=A0AA87Z3J3_FICCA|nr:hypothetical protein TIFTF001_001881 [Ficus carica]
MSRVLMPKMAPIATPSMVGLSSEGWPVAPPSITCKREVSRNDGDICVVSAVGTPMLNSVGASLGSGCSGQPGRVGYLGHSMGD